MRIRPSAIIIKDGKILTLKYQYAKGLIYAIPGGNLEFGEEIKDALNRELLEEIGVETTLGEVWAIAETFHEQENTIHFIFKSNTLSTEPLLNPEETTALEIVWLPIDELDNYVLYPNIGSFINKEQNDSPIFLGVINQPRY